MRRRRLVLAHSPCETRASRRPLARQHGAIGAVGGPKHFAQSAIGRTTSSSGAVHSVRENRKRGGQVELPAGVKGTPTWARRISPTQETSPARSRWRINLLPIGQAASVLAGNSPRAVWWVP